MTNTDHSVLIISFNSVVAVEIPCPLTTVEFNFLVFLAGAKLPPGNFTSITNERATEMLLNALVSLELLTKDKTIHKILTCQSPPCQSPHYWAILSSFSYDG
ncbi:MAG: hypothetical protein HS132_02710 [Planctomycetia bacterium]|nr:hypothetical protein [Planctomycetia bacterium]